jgi:hypothetical protein
MGWLQGIPNLPPQVADLAMQIEKKVQHGDVKLRGVSSFALSEADRQNKLSTDGQKVSLALVEQGKRKPASVSDAHHIGLSKGVKNLTDQYDIWHSNWTTSLFEIVSDRIKLFFDQQHKRVL